MQTLSKKVYLAPDILFGYLDRTDNKHSQIAAYFRYFAQNQYHLYTDSISIYQAYEKVVTEMSRSIANEFLRTLFLSNINIIYPDESDIRAAIKILLNDKTNELTFQVAVMVVLADRRGISQICTTAYIHTMFGLSIFYLPM